MLVVKWMSLCKKQIPHLRKNNEYMKYQSLIAATFLVAVFGCNNATREKAKTELPYYGQYTEMIIEDDKPERIDTNYKQLNNFALINQDSQIITADDFKGKIRVVDFFFTSCPTICPDMKKQMMRIYKRFENNDRITLLSHSIDTRNDSVPVLKKYADKMNVSAPKWHLVTGDKKIIYNLAEQHMVPAQRDDKAPGGYLHSGQFILIDGNHHIRGYYDGIKADDVDQLMDDIEILLKEK